MSARAALVAFMLGLLASPGGLRAAESAATTEAARATPAPAVIPVSDILARADADETFAAGVIRRADATDPSPRLSRQAAEIAVSVDQKQLSQSPRQLGRLSVVRLESLARHWSFDMRRQSAWQQDLRLSYAATVDDATQVALRRAEWEATREAAEMTTLPAAMGDRIPEVIEALSRAEEALSPRLATQVSLGRRGNALHERIARGRDQVNAAIAEVDRRLLRQDAPPLWAAQADADYPQAIEHLLQGMASEMRFATDYARYDVFNRANRALHLLLLPLLLWLSRRTRHSPAPPAHRDPAWHALRRPWSAWLLLVTMLVLTLETDAPLLVRQSVMIVALIPVLRQLTPAFHRRFAPWPWAVTGLYLLSILRFLLASEPRIFRLYVLGIAVGGAVLVSALLLRARARAPAPQDHTARWLRIAGWIGAGLLGLSALANVIGTVSLAEMLSSAAIDSAYLALALYAGQVLVAGLFQTLLDSKALPRVIARHAGSLERVGLRMLRIAAVAGWLLYTLENFRVLRPAYRTAKSILSRTLTVGELSISLGHIVVFALAVFIAYWAARLVRLILEDEVLSRMSLPRGVSNTIASLTYYVLLLLGWLLALSAAGLQLSQLSLLLGALGVGIGFGLQNIVNHFVSGLILMVERPLQPGDVVDIGDATGRVREIGMRATTLQTFEGADVIVPNGTVLSASLRNWSLTDPRRRIQVDLGVAYGADPARVMQVLKEAIAATPGICRTPEPGVQFTGLREGSLDFSVSAWAPDYDSASELRSELTARLHAALGAAGIGIFVPHHELHLDSRVQVRPGPPPPVPR